MAVEIGIGGSLQARRNPSVVVVVAERCVSTYLTVISVDRGAPNGYALGDLRQAVSSVEYCGGLIGSQW